MHLLFPLGGMLAGIYNEPEKPNDGDNPVRVVISAGTPQPIWDAFEKRFNVKILEWYGSVEGGFAYKPIGQGPVGSFGKPVPGVMEFKVVDEEDKEVAAGTSGELICRMMKGETKWTTWASRMIPRKRRGADGSAPATWCTGTTRAGISSTSARAPNSAAPATSSSRSTWSRSSARHHVSEVCVFGIPAVSGAPGESDLVAALEPFEGKTIDPASVYQFCREQLETTLFPPIFSGGPYPKDHHREGDDARPEGDV